MSRDIPILQVILLGILPNVIKKTIYRIKGYKIGKNVIIGFGSVIIAKHCEIEPNVNIGYFSIINSNNIKIGKNSNIRSLTYIDTPFVKIGQDVIISEFTIIRAGHKSIMSKINIGNRVHIFPKVIIDSSYPIEIGDETGIGFYSNLYTHGSYKNILEGYNVNYGEIKIGKRVELTYNVFVAPGVIIDDDVIVGYGSYVNRNLPYGVLAAGIPVKIKRQKEQFAPTPNSLQKEKIIENIINEFCKNLLFLNKIIKHVYTNGVWSLFNKDFTCNIVLIKTIGDKIGTNKQDVNIILLEKDIFSSESNKVIYSYFELNKYLCFNNSWPFYKELRRYLGRYGIRFENLEEFNNDR